MLSAAGQAFSEAFTPPFRAVLLKCMAFTIGLLVLLIIGIEWTFSHFVQWPAWIEQSIEWLGGLALVVGSIFLIPPVTSLIAGLYLDDIAALVERKHYPADPAGEPLPTLQAIGVGLRFFAAVLLVSLISLFLLLVPGVNLIAYYFGNGYLLGREYFELAAMRFRPIEEARALRRANALRIFLAGLAIAAIVIIPILNLITPVFATALMVRMHKKISRENPAPAALAAPAD